jgi:MOSC domain-containing protein YiiM
MIKSKKKFTIEAVCISKKKGVQKNAVDSVDVIEDFGIKNDAHAGDWHRQISFLAAEAIDTMRAEGLSLEPGAFGENIVTRGIDWTKVKTGGKIRMGEVELEVTQIGKECHTPCAIFYKAGRCIMPEMGVFAKVLKGGVIQANRYGYYSFR